MEDFTEFEQIETFMKNRDANGSQGILIKILLYK